MVAEEEDKLEDEHAKRTEQGKKSDGLMLSPNLVVSDGLMMSSAKLIDPGLGELSIQHV